MPQKMITDLHKYIGESDPSEEELRKFVRDLAYRNNPTDRTITVRYSQMKKHIREIHPNYSDEFLRSLNPPKELTAKIIAENKERKMERKLVKFDAALLNKIYDLRESENVYEQAIYLQFISGRRINEIFDSDFRVSSKDPRQVSMRLSKKSDDKKYHKFELLKDTSDNREFRDMLKKMRTSVNGIQIKDFTNRVNRKIRDVVRKDLSSHDLRGLYAVLKYETDNPDNLGMIAHINKSLNHGQTSIDSSVSYSNFQYDPN
jgi:hypothetical protein